MPGTETTKAAGIGDGEPEAPIDDNHAREPGSPPAADGTGTETTKPRDKAGEPSGGQEFSDELAKEIEQALGRPFDTLDETERSYLSVLGRRMQAGLTKSQQKLAEARKKFERFEPYLDRHDQIAEALKFVEAFNANPEAIARNILSRHGHGDARGSGSGGAKPDDANPADAIIAELKAQGWGDEHIQPLERLMKAHLQAAMKPLIETINRDVFFPLQQQDYERRKEGYKAELVEMATKKDEYPYFDRLKDVIMQVAASSPDAVSLRKIYKDIESKIGFKEIIEHEEMRRLEDIRKRREAAGLERAGTLTGETGGPPVNSPVEAFERAKTRLRKAGKL